MIIKLHSFKNRLSYRNDGTIKPGYKEKLVSVSVAHGEMAELDVVLDKI